MKLNRLAIAVIIALLAISTSPLQAQLSFEFTLTDNNTGFNDPTQGAARRSALQTAAQRLADMLPTQTPVTLTFTVNSNNNNDDTLASAGSPTFSDDNGFLPTVAEHKAITGVDGNGTAADGEITWNFFHNWDLDDDVAPDASDFISTAMHEILHAMGFGGAIDSAGQGLFGEPVGTADAWNTFDQFLVNEAGVRFVDSSFVFNASLLPALTGGSSIFFNGPNAVAANGGDPVVIYSPTIWEDGSSASHTDDETYVGTNRYLMNAATDDGPGVRTLSAVELGILQDLGYVFASEGGGGGGGNPGDFAYLSNLSVRTLAGSGAQTLIAGFAIAGGEKPLLIRGVGPTLGDFGVTGALANPRLGIFDGSNEVVSNDDWDSTTISAVADRVGAFAIPAGSNDAALLVDLAPGVYTVQMSGVGDGTGVGLIEVYDAD